MPDSEKTSLTLVLTYHGKHKVPYVKATTWGTSGGKYGSLGVVEFPVSQMPETSTQADLARLILTALYGGNYDL